MQCEKCQQNQATIHLTEIIEGKRNETHLCQACAQKSGIGTKSEIPLNELLNSLLAASELLPGKGAAQSSFGDAEVSTCPQCGSSWDDFKKQSQLGCPNDYTVFENQLGGLLQKIHNGETQHRGKVPCRIPDSGKRQIELVRLRKELKDAIALEKYETAAQLRDKITSLEKWN